MAAVRAGLVRSAETDGGLADDEGRAAVGLDGFGKDGVDLGDVVGVVAAEDAPVVGGVAGGDVFGEGEAGVALDGDLVLPSIMQPSPLITKMRLCWMSVLSRPILAANCLAAIAMPTAEPKPLPSGPVVMSTPLVWPNSGWPGVRLPHWRKLFSSSMDRP